MSSTIWWPARSSLRWYIPLLLTGLVALTGWGVWWKKSVHRNVLIYGDKTWTPAWQFLGVDFTNNYLAARHWLRGGNPYREPFGDPLGRGFCYPPLVLPAFAWCGWCTPRSADRVWLWALTGFAALGAWAACRSRRELGLWDVPFVFGLAAVLFSSPVVYAMERGNYDLLVLLPILMAAWALRRSSHARDGLAGLCLALAAVLKVYPALLVLGLLPLRRFRAFAYCAAACVLLLAVDPGHLGDFRRNVQGLMESDLLSTSSHSLSAPWRDLWSMTGTAWPASIPRTIAAAMLLSPAVLLVGYQLVRCRESGRVLVPYMLWLTAVATFVPQTSNDYSLVFLPMAALAVWDRRDSVFVHMGMALLLIWAQPMALSIGPRLLLGFKLLSLAAVTGSLLGRIREQAARTIHFTRPQMAQRLVALPFLKMRASRGEQLPLAVQK